LRFSARKSLLWKTTCCLKTKVVDLVPELAKLLQADLRVSICESGAMVCARAHKAEAVRIRLNIPLFCFIKQSTNETEVE
jgi:hypothetical protein